MTLAKTVTDLPIHGGKTDEQDAFIAVQPGNAEVYEARYRVEGSIAKRHGMRVANVLYPTTYTPRWYEEGGGHTVTEHDGRHVLLGHDGAIAEDEAAGAWTQLGKMGPRPSRVKTDPHIRGSNPVRHPDCAVGSLNGKTVCCTVWHDIDADVVRYAWHELPSDGRPPVALYGPETLAGSLTRVPRVSSAGGVWMIVGTDNVGTGGNNAYSAICTPASSYAFGTASLMDAAAEACNLGCIEIVSVTDASTGFLVVYPISGGYRARRMTTANASVTSRDMTSTAFPLAACQASDGVNRRFFVALSDGSVTRWPSDLSAAGTNAALVTPTSAYVHAATVAPRDSSGNLVVCFSGSGVALDGLGLGSYGVDVCLASFALSLTERSIVGQCRLGGCAVWNNVATPWPLLAFANVQSDLGTNVLQYRSGYFARIGADIDGVNYPALVGAIGTDIFYLANACWDFSRVATERLWHMPSIEYTAAGEYVMAYPVVIDNSVGDFDVYTAVDFARCATVEAPQNRSVTAASTRIVSGGGVAYTDGIQLAELTPPPIVSATSMTKPDYDADYLLGPTDPSIPWTTSSAYIKLAIRWRDQKGNVHRSLPSEEFTWTWYELDGALYYATRLNIPRPWPCALAPSDVLYDRGGHYQVEVYQAKNTGELFYFRGLATPKPHPTYDQLDYIVLTSGTIPTGHPEGASIVAGPDTAGTPELWTQAGEYIHIPPPPMVDLCSTQQRLWGLSGEKGRLEVWPSKVITDGYAPEFAPELVQRIPTEGGECTAIAALDDKVVVFKERAIFVLFGDPGDNFGQRATLQPARLISSDVGCSNANSVVEGPFGIAFQASSTSESARAGIHVIDRGLAISYVGAPAKEISAGVTFASATLVPAEKEVRWLMGDASRSCLVWSYDVGRWHVRTQIGDSSSTTRRGTYSTLSRYTGPTQDVVAYEADTFSIEDTHEMSVTTSWIKLDGLQGYQRIYMFGVLLRRYTGALTIEYALDYSDTWYPAKAFSSAALDALQVAGGRCQVWIGPADQKCESIRLRITEDAGNTPGQGFELVGLSVKYGRKGTGFSKGSTVDARK